MSDHIGQQAVGTAGTGKYDGYTWDGRHWVDDTGHTGRFNPWERTSVVGKIIVVGVAAIAVLSIGLSLTLR